MTTNTRLSTEKEPQNPKLWQCEDPPEYQRSPKRDLDGKPLEKVYKRMKDYDKGMCDAWRDEIEKLLIFAGLFAATVTPFALDSYKWLQEDNTASSTKLLAQISLQLAAMANNSSGPAVSLPDSSAFTPLLSRNVIINLAWFYSLTICLSTVIVGILCLQWLREYTRESSFGSFDAVTVRQMRYEGLFYWQVPDIISFLPMALQGAVLCFFVGIVALLWSLHPVVAAVTTIIGGFVTAAVGVAAIIPIIQSAFFFDRPRLHAGMKQCPYKSPLSWQLFRLAMFVDRHSFHFSRYSSKDKLTSWNEVDVAWDKERTLSQDDKYNVQGLAKALAWTITKLTPAGANSDIVPEIFHSLHFDLPTHLSCETLQSCATFIDDQNHKVMVALQRVRGEQIVDHSHGKVQNDLLMTWFLQRHSFILKCDDLLMELRLRCLNTLLGRTQMDDMFDEVLREMASSNMEDANVCELRFQTMATILDYIYHRHHSSRVTLDHVGLSGQAVAEYIRCTPVTADNALMCYEIHERFKRLLEHTLSSTHDHDASIYGEGHPYPRPQIAALLLCRLDLRIVEAWEKNITRITGKQIPRLIFFLEQRILPALEARDTLTHFATQVKRQLDAMNITI